LWIVLRPFVCLSVCLFVPSLLQLSREKLEQIENRQEDVLVTNN